MSPLFDNENWSRSGGQDVPLPSFLRDDAPGIPGPSDVNFTFRAESPTHERIAAQTWGSADPASDAGVPGRAYPMPAAPMAAPYEPPAPYGQGRHAGYGDPAESEYNYAEQNQVEYQPEYGETQYSQPEYPESAYSTPTYSEYSEPAAPEPEYPYAAYTESPYGAPVAGEPVTGRAWDPLTDPWPAPGGPAAEPAWPFPVQPGRDELPSDHPSGPLPRTPAGPPTFPPVEDYDVTLMGALGYADLGFRDGQWYSLGGTTPRPISTRDALRAHPDLGGSIVQVVCLWMRENPHDLRALDLATELAFAVGELSREAARIPR